MRTIISTKDCYEGRNIHQGCMQTGSFNDLYDSGNIDIDSIEWSDSAWNSETDYFLDLINCERNKYEKRYKTKVLELALCGHIQLYNKNDIIDGKLVSFNNPISMGDANDIDVILDDDRNIIINGYHCNGKHSMYLYFLTESSMKRIGIFDNYDCEDNESFDTDDYKIIYNKLKPIKIPKNNKYFS